MVDQKGKVPNRKLPRRGWLVPVILALVAFGFYLLSIYMQYQQSTGAS